MKKGMLFIDGSNVYHDWTAGSSGKQLSIEKYIDTVKTKFPDLDFVRTYYFTSEAASNKPFLYSVNRLPYCEVITGRLQAKKIDLKRHSVDCPNCKNAITSSITTYVDKGTDVNIAVEMLRHSFNNGYDTAILASRDADFASVVRIIKSLSHNVELVVFETAKDYAHELTDCVDRVVILDANDRTNCEAPVSTPVPTTAPATTVTPSTATSSATTTAPTAATSTGSAATSAGTP